MVGVGKKWWAWENNGGHLKIIVGVGKNKKRINFDPFFL
jgi:hypothetical protein